MKAQDTRKAVDIRYKEQEKTPYHISEIRNPTSAI